MAGPRKPIPKSQLTISNSKQDAFKGIEDRGAVGNPNKADINVNTFSQAQSTGIDFNRYKKTNISKSNMSFKNLSAVLGIFLIEK